MQEINEAYDTIINARRTSKNNAGGQQGYNANAAGSQFPDVRRLIGQNRIDDAEEILNGVAELSRNAEWYYLKGMIFYRRGWMDQAMSYYARAVQLSLIHILLFRAPRPINI